MLWIFLILILHLGSIQQKEIGMKRRQSCLIGLYQHTQLRETLIQRILPVLTGRMWPIWSLAEMMLNVNTSGIKDINLISQKLSGKREKMMSYLESYLRKDQNNGKKLLML